MELTSSRWSRGSAHWIAEEFPMKKKNKKKEKFNFMGKWRRIDLFISLKGLGHTVFR